MTMQFNDSSLRGRRSINLDVRYSPCTGECDYMCRCTRVVGWDLEEMSPYNTYEATRSFYGTKGMSMLDRILLFRFFSLYMRKSINKSDINVSILPGYYGEEVSSTSFTHDFVSMATDDAQYFQAGSSADRVRRLLFMEYGYVLERLASVEKWHTKLVPIEDVRANKEKLRAARDYHYSYLVKEKAWTAGVLVDSDMTLIDGHHRLKGAQSAGLEKIHVVIPK